MIDFGKGLHCEVGIGNGLFCGNQGQLGKSTHPLRFLLRFKKKLWIKSGNFACNSARQVRCVEKGNRTDAGFASEKGFPEGVFTDAVCREHTEPGYDHSVFADHALNPHLIKPSQ